MKILLTSILTLCLWSCNQIDHKISGIQSQPSADSVNEKSYAEIKKDISAKRKEFAISYPSLNDSAQKEISDYWIRAIGTELYSKWENTPWDFNGTTKQPQQGSIACGYFVTTILQDMDLALNRVKLSTCASSVMMKSLTPHQRLKNLSYLSFEDFDDSLKRLGKGVYIIGLDFHTGFIINDGIENWFIHSNYIGRKGVTKEPVLHSEALRASRTRWLVCLTNDKDFLYRWLKS